MAQLNRADLNDDIASKVYTNVGRLIKGNTVRDRLLNLGESTLNIIDDANQPGGYLAIDEDDEIVDVSFIKKVTPTNQFLRDDGTWQTVLTATSGLSDVLAADNVMLNAQFIQSQNGYLKLAVVDYGAELSCVVGDLYVGAGVSSTSGYIYFYDDTAGGQMASALTQNTIEHTAKNYFNALINEINGELYVTGDYIENYAANTFYANGANTEFSLSNNNFKVGNVNGAFRISDIVYVENRTIQIKTTENLFKHNVKNSFDAPFHEFNNIITLDGLFLEYDGNSEGLVNIDTGNDYGGIKNGSQYVMINSNTGYVELYSSNTVKMRVDKDQNFIEFTAPKIETNASIYVTSGQGIDSKATGGTDIVNVGGTNADVVNIGRAGGIVNILGQHLYEYAGNQYVLDKLITLNYNGASGSAVGSGLEIEAGGAIVAYVKVNAAQTGYSFKSPDTSYYADLIFTNFTANRVLEIPDETGVLATRAYSDAKVADAITDGVTTIAPSQNVVFDGLALKSNIASPTFTGTVTTPAIVVSGETASRVAMFDGSSNIKSADTATYPSLAEFAHVKGVTSAIQTQIDTKTNKTLTTNRQTASYTLVLSDKDLLVEMNVAGANNMTVPLNSTVAFPIGTQILGSQYGAGQTTIVATGGVTLRSAGGALKSTAQYAGWTLVKIDTDEWYVFGSLTV